VLAAVRRLNRFALLGETLRAALNALVVQGPEWLQAWVPLDWLGRYARRIEQWRLPGAKKNQGQWMHQIGQDGSTLLTKRWTDHTPLQLRCLPEVEGLRRMWVQHYQWEDGQIFVRNKDDLPPAH
jgi:hypothetical protein